MTSKQIRGRWINIFRHFLPGLFCCVFLFNPSQSTNADSSAYTPSQVIASINSYRAANGLPAYQTNSTLMAVAQGQADYQASINAVTHTGPGGTTPKDRLYAAGYGGGNTIFASEIIYGGTNTTVNTAMSWWKNSTIHNQSMLASTYVEIGAGVATNGERTYYTAVMAYITGSSLPNSDSGSETNSSANNPPAAIIIPMIKATPQADGRIIHIIRTGQALWTVSVVYKVPLEDILDLNDLPENAWVFPGDEILVRPPDPPTQTPSPTDTPKPTATQILEASPTPRPTRTPRGTAVSIANTQASAADDVSAQAPITSQDSTIRWVVIIAFVAVFLVVGVGLVIPKDAEESSESDD